MVCLDINKPWPDLWDPSDCTCPIIHNVSSAGGHISSDHMMHDIVINISGHLYVYFDYDEVDLIHLLL